MGIADHVKCFHNILHIEASAASGPMHHILLYVNPIILFLEVEVNKNFIAKFIE